MQDHRQLHLPATTGRIASQIVVIRASNTRAEEISRGILAFRIAKDTIDSLHIDTAQ
jgi:hypothetical protein